jgi:hypothetical protein
MPEQATNTGSITMARNSQNAKTMRPKTELHPNLSKGPAKPALGNGRLQVQCRRALAAFDGLVSTGDCYNWCYPRHDRRQASPYWRIWRALRQIGAVRVGRAKTMGRPWLWAWTVTPTVTPDDE